jgi:hypothetical protein
MWIPRSLITNVARPAALAMIPARGTQASEMVTPLPLEPEGRSQ